MSRVVTASRLWRWAHHRVKDPLFLRQPDEHHDIEAFVDAIHASAKVLRWVYPFAQGLAKFRHALRGTQMPAELQGVHLLENWNSSESFIDGAERIHEALLEAMWRPASVPLPAVLREATSQDARSWLDACRQTTSAGPSPLVEDVSHPVVGRTLEGMDSHGLTARVMAVYGRFDRFYGPESLEMIRHMDVSKLGSIRSDEKRLAAFHHDTFQGSVLQLQVALVSETHLLSATENTVPVIAVRRADRLHLSCDFNLREGIASDFRVSAVEGLDEEARRGGFPTDEATE
eukprot:TRINITY_DN73886_c0_g1_i1.p1 TRINITY_DN73886_c0_g1~~TRINITY_DN73886_c0_g1_i1.p1  ORF type:complete len:288 (+),score=16.46 TRINITY_DN73886_c0_g1_i1:48-911(+)